MLHIIYLFLNLWITFYAKLNKLNKIIKNQIDEIKKDMAFDERKQSIKFNKPHLIA
ncbi:hypothetical protein DZS_21800 [Dickeya ananatis]